MRFVVRLFLIFSLLAVAAAADEDSSVSLPMATVEILCSGDVSATSAPGVVGEAFNNNVTFAEDRFGNAGGSCYFNGEDAFIEIPDADVFSISTTGALTVSAWLSPESLNFENNDNGYVHWMGKGVPQQHEWAFRMYNKDLTEGQEQRPNRISAYAFNLSGSLGSGSYVQETISAGEWVHIVARYDMESNTISIFKNGVLKDTDLLTDDTYNVHPENGSAPVRIGTRSQWSYFKGRIDDVRFYDRTLSENEINSLYNELDPAQKIGSADSTKETKADSSGITAIQKTDTFLVRPISKTAPNIYQKNGECYLVNGQVKE